VNHEHVRVEADGGSRGNPGPAGYGAAVTDPATGEVLAERSEAIGVETNNVAEYRGLIAGLEAARDLGARRVSVYMDSKLVVEQMKGAWQVKNEGLRPLSLAAHELRRSFDQVSFEWIPREQNKHADRLANEAMDRAAGRPAAARTAQRSGTSSEKAWAPPSTVPTRLFLVRHGSTAHSKEGRFSGQNDLVLDEAGVGQAAALAQRAASFGDVAAIVSSPVLRTQQTAEAIAAELDLPVVINKDFAEVNFGEWDGLTFGEVRAAYPTLMKEWFASPAVAPPAGESMEALGRRVRRGRDAVIAAYPDKRVIVVTHVSPIKSLVRAVLDAPASSLYRMHLDTASLSIVDYFADGGASLRLFNDTSHLDTGGHGA
jgi:ribonuclease H / adenosylcobalamin/alpha-ribazole phosphatase